MVMPRLGFCVPPELAEAVRTAAAEDRRSLSSFITTTLEDVIETRKRRKAKRQRKISEPEAA